MPKKKQPQKQQVAPVPKVIVKETLVPEPLTKLLEPLVMEDRDYLQGVFSDARFIKAFRHARALKPTAFVKLGSLPNADLMSAHANNRLHEIRGWEAFEAALLGTAIEPANRVVRRPEEFPDAGTIDSHFAQQLAQPPATKPKSP